MRKSDEAEYHCRAENRQGVDTLRTILYVKGEDQGPPPSQPPSQPPAGLSVYVVSPQVEARVGESVRMRCDSSDPQARVQWDKEGGALPLSATQTPDGQLTMYSVSEGDSGTYICTAVAPSGQTARGYARLQVSSFSSG